MRVVAVLLSVRDLANHQIMLIKRSESLVPVERSFTGRGRVADAHSAEESIRNRVCKDMCHFRGVYSPHAGKVVCREAAPSLRA